MTMVQGGFNLEFTLSRLYNIFGQDGLISNVDKTEKVMVNSDAQSQRRTEQNHKIDGKLNSVWWNKHRPYLYTRFIEVPLGIRW